MNIFELLKLTLKRDASDLHLTPGCSAVLRVHGHLVPVNGKKLSADDVREMVFPVLSPHQKQRLEEKRSVDLSYLLRDIGRFRINVYYQRGEISAAFRRLYDKIFSIDELGLPQGLAQLADLRDGLVLVTGPTGCGKSTTLATIIDLINQTRSVHIITIEDPIEYFHQHKQSIVTQRELYVDIHSFAEAMRDSLREDPDVIFVGEMRDIDTMRSAITAAETGHLVFSTLHTRDTVSSISRILGVFPSVEQQYIRQQLSDVLKAVVSQRLLTCSCGTRRRPSVEIMKVTKGISNLIRLGKTEQIYSSIETGASLGMQTMEQSLVNLLRQGHIDKQTAFKMAKSVELIKQRTYML
ncbi:MAG: type IV pilus twitching motility protein PilT [Candidatus Omnitrophica bacterium]|nr:type IV pilus twitching motility protein PilT [Candidatus Omnitrophota bacterium]